MLITNIVKKDGRKSIIFLDYDKGFELYSGEIKRLEIHMNEEIPEKSYEEIMTDILPKRCMERAMYLLESSDKTENDLRIKLRQGTYPETIIDDVIEKLRNYGYIDDDRYALNYIQYYIKSKSRKRIAYDLNKKGVKKEVIDMAFEKYIEKHDEIEEMQKKIIVKEFQKRKFDFSVKDISVLNKIIQSLMRKGFRYEDIMQVYYELDK